MKKKQVDNIAKIIDTRQKTAGRLGGSVIPGRQAITKGGKS
jgi:hypothetical protein